MKLFSLATLVGVLGALLVAFIAQVFLFSPISPDVLEHLSSASADSAPTNNHLQKVTKLGEGLLNAPEDVWVTSDGVLYAADRDGWIKRMQRDGSWEDWRKIESNALLGITISRDGSLIVCDGEESLLRVDDGGVTVLASHVSGSKIRFADDVIESSDGSLYFSVPSTKFELHNWYLDVLEAKPNGQLLKYDVSTKETAVLVDNLCFPNGVALSKDEDYLVFCESWRHRCLKYWLKGESEGLTEVFIDNLPGGPDNINLAPDGSFWIALLQITSEGLEFAHNWKALKHLIASSPRLVQAFVGADKKATVVNVSPEGNIVRRFDDPAGKVMSFVTSAFEFEGHLYFGSLKNNFVGKLSLKDHGFLQFSDAEGHKHKEQCY